MVKAVTFLLFLAFLFTFSQAKSIIPQPQQFRSFKINNTQNVKSCSYTVSITTSCSSTKYTRDQISLAFGDAYGNQVYAPRLDDPSTGTFERCSRDTFQILGPCSYQDVYAPRLDDPSTGTFERCSRDTFQILGPCSYQICYVYLYRSGFDGWMPEKVTIYGYNTKSATFYYNTYIPNYVWYGFNFCNGASVSTM
ncbi:embryo-specific protein ats3b [Quercus suber]|uniref:Embryo-specific protein ats3b n=1 Tax=Quercus suber TaxID=58331 RepID=A0AAW0KHF0_QUESU